LGVLSATISCHVATDRRTGVIENSEDRAGQYSIRVNDRWRICFEWRDGEAWEVEIVDYR
jgi:hypothetical protein